MSDVTEWLREQIEAVEAEAEADMVEAAAEGYGAWVTGIETLGTGMGVWNESWWKANPFRNESPFMSAGSDGSSPGRVHTGYMRDSVEVSFGKRTAEIGFLNRYENYFRQQEEGFHNEEAKVDVEGMHAQAAVHMVIDDALEGKGWKKR